MKLKSAVSRRKKQKMRSASVKGSMKINDTGGYKKAKVKSGSSNKRNKAKSGASVKKKSPKSGSINSGSMQMRSGVIGEQVNPMRSARVPRNQEVEGVPYGEQVDAMRRRLTYMPEGMNDVPEIQQVFDKDIGFGVAMPGESGEAAVQRIKQERKSKKKKRSKK